MTASFTVSNVNRPILAFSTTANGQSGAVAYLQGLSGNTLTVTLYAGSGSFSADVYVYVFDQVLPSIRSTYGLHVMDASGNTIFDSAYPPARIVDYLKSYTGWPSSGSSSATPASGKIYALIPGGYGWTRYVGSKNVSTGDIIANDFVYGTSGGYGVTASTYDGSIGTYLCYKGNLPMPHGTPGGSPGDTLYSCGLLSGALVVDVTGL